MERDLDLVNAFCDEAKDLLIQWEAVCLDLSKDFISRSKWDELFRMAHNLKGGSRSVGLIEYGDFVHKVEDAITVMRDQKVRVRAEHITLLLQAQAILTSWCDKLKEDANFIWDYPPFLNLVNSAMETEAGAGSSASKEIGRGYVTASANVEQDFASNQRIEKFGGTISSQESIRIPAQKLDQLIQAIGELSIHQSIIWHTKGESLTQNKMFLNSLHLSQKLTKELYDRALGLRMQTMKTLFQRLERNLVDLATSLGKDVNVTFSGSEVELDKTVIEKVSDPLMHIVRNAIDHGIENSADRIIDGKSESGHIDISATHDTHGILIRVKDDGKGLNTEKIQAKAVAKGLITETQELSKAEIFNLIFLPGFSTAEKVTEVSGRGVGMDVVRRSLEDLRGTIRIDSELGKGTEFTISLPTSVSIVDGVLFKLSGQTYVAPINSVEEVINVFDLEIAGESVMMNLRNKVIPVQDLDDHLKHRPDLRTPTANKKAALICVSQGHRVAFLADDVLGKQQIVIRPLHDNIDGAFGILGGTILGNGEPGLILDLNSLIQKYLSKFNGKEHAA